MSDDRTTPATKGDLSDLRSEFKTVLQGLKDELLEAIHDGQTAMLKAFYGFTQTVQDRFREAD